MGRMKENFAMLGVGGFVAPRHLKAIADTGHELVAACDPYDSVGMMDHYFPNASFLQNTSVSIAFLKRAGVLEKTNR